MFKNKLNKKAQLGGGLVTGLIFGIASLIIGVIIAFIIVSTLLSAGLLTGKENSSAQSMGNNFSAGVDNVSEQIPTILLIAAIVLILGVLAILVVVWQKMRIGGGSI